MPRKSNLPYLRDMARRYKLGVVIPQIVSPTLSACAMYAIAKGLMRHIPDNPPVVWMLTGAAFWSDKVLNMIAIDRWQWFEAQAREAHEQSIKQKASSFKVSFDQTSEDGTQAGAFYNFDLEWGADKLQEICKAIVKAGKFTERVTRKSGYTRKDYLDFREKLFKHHLATRASDADNAPVVLRDSGWLVIKALAARPTGSLRVVRLSDFRGKKQARALSSTVSPVGEG